MLVTALCLTGAAQDSTATAPEAAEAPAPPAEEWISLFNGENLDGWTPKIRGYELGDNWGDTFRVQDGVIKTAYDKYTDGFNGRFGHLFYKEPFSNYRLRVEYRFVGEQADGGPGWAWRNSGVMIHGQAPETMRKDQEFPVSIEVQLLGGPEEGERHTANLCTPGTNVVMEEKLIRRHCTDSVSKTFPGDQWVTAEVEVKNGTITHFINGEAVLQYSEPQLDENDADAQRLMEEFSAEKMIKGGTISLQSESHPVEFRKVEIMKIAD
ncbi:MAG: DUF1080 domain-containing protein [Candidatus Hydrogenedentes bacterium]|nr:DUF1080 domain-containing protein [Candidatus Hydrogenedentota bacterium]